MIGPRLASLGLLAGLSLAAQTLQPSSTERPLGECPGYKASNVKTSATGLTADLKLAGAACNTYGTDLEKLRLEVTYENGEWHTPRDHVFWPRVGSPGLADMAATCRKPPSRQDPGRRRCRLPGPGVRLPSAESRRVHREEVGAGVSVQDQPLFVLGLTRQDRRGSVRLVGSTARLPVSVPAPEDQAARKPKYFRVRRDIRLVSSQHDRLHQNFVEPRCVRYSPKLQPVRQPPGVL